MNQTSLDVVGQVALLRHLCRRNDRATAELVAAMTLAGAPVVVLKGAATRALLKLDERPSADVDLLVAPGGRRDAERVLRARGYRRELGVHSDTWTHPHAVPVDLHRSLPRVGLDPRECWGVIAMHSIDMDLDGITVQTLDRPTQLVHLAIHTTLDSATQPKEDLAVAIAEISEEQWQRAAGMARRLRVSSTVAWALEQANAPALAAMFGPAELAPNDIGERGVRAFLDSEVNPAERRRRTLRLGAKWARWQAGRCGRLLTGRSAWYARQWSRRDA